MFTLAQRHFLRKTDTLLIGEDAFVPWDEPFTPEETAALTLGTDGKCSICHKPQDEHCLQPAHLSYAPMDSRKRCPGWTTIETWLIPCGPQPIQTQVVILDADLVRKLTLVADRYYADDIEA